MFITRKYTQCIKNIYSQLTENQLKCIAYFKYINTKKNIL